MDYSQVQLDPELVRKAQNCMLDILREIDKICKKHNITYWLEGGGALGAVRHKGFIPWDDDLDIDMLRCDYEKFMHYAVKELPDQYIIQTREHDPRYNKHIPRICRLGSKLIKHDEDDNEKYYQGIYVEIFIFDYFHCWETKVCDFFNIMPGIRTRRTKYPKGSFKRCLHGILTAIPYAVHRGLELLYLNLRRLCRKNSNLPILAYDPNIACTGYYPKELILPVSFDYTFEGEHFPLPHDVDKYLTIMYGDYMQLPPPEDRRTHSRLIEVPEEYLNKNV